MNRTPSDLIEYHQDVVNKRDRITPSDLINIIKLENKSDAITELATAKNYNGQYLFNCRRVTIYSIFDEFLQHLEYHQDVVTKRKFKDTINGKKVTITIFDNSLKDIVLNNYINKYVKIFEELVEIGKYDE